MIRGYFDNHTRYTEWNNEKHTYEFINDFDILELKTIIGELEDKITELEEERDDLLDELRNSYDDIEFYTNLYYDNGDY